MNIDRTTTVHELLQAYPYLMDWLVGYDSHFDALKNPVLYNTMAKRAKLETAADLAHVPVEQFLDDIRTQIAQHEIAAEELAGATAATPSDPEEAARRQAALKAIILKLHDGAPVEQVKAEFDALATGVDSAEIARMEQALIAEGMPIEDVQRLCDVHVTVFKESLDTHREREVDSGHPLDAYRRENEVVSALTAKARTLLDRLESADAADVATALAELDAELGELSLVRTHYVRKENQLFPVLEKHEVTGPTKVMWGLDDDIVARIASARALVAAGDRASLLATLPETLTMVDDMVYKEEKILFPTALDLLSAEEWASMAEGDAEIGYAWMEPGAAAPGGSPAQRADAPTAPAAADSGELLLPLPTGALTLAQLDLLFRALPFDVTYVDENDRVRFYSEGERVFPRSPGAIGREVRNCHPPKSLAKVEEILAEFKAGTKDVAEFWIEMPASFERREASARNDEPEAAEAVSSRFIHIRYFALRDADGAYKGCLEVVQDATHVRALQGQRRIVDW